MAIPVSKILDDALALFKEGKNWIKGNEKIVEGHGDDTKVSFCAIGAIKEAGRTDYSAREIAQSLVRAAIKDRSIAGFNDDDKTEFEDIVRVFKKAKKAALSLEQDE